MKLILITILSYLITLVVLIPIYLIFEIQPELAALVFVVGGLLLTVAAHDEDFV